MKKILLLIVSITLCMSTVWADKVASITQGEELYKQGKFADALTAFQAVEKDSLISSELYYNIGNCFFKMGDPTKAILYYERALVLSPKDKDAKYNLKMAQRSVVDKITVLPEFFLTKWYKGAKSSFSVDAWGYISVGLFIAFLIMLSLFFYASKRGVKQVGFFGSIVMLVIFIWSMFVAQSQKELYENKEMAIVTTPSVVVRSSPDNSGTELFVIHEGLKVKVLEKVGEWFNVQLADGNEGWIKVEDIEKI